MKKIIALLLVTVFAVLALSACSYLPTDYELSLGIYVNEEDGETTETSCALLTDASGRIVLCRIDATQFPLITEDGKLPISKKSLGDDYNMAKYSDAIAEWYEQAAYYERALVGKTLEEAMLIVTGSDALKAGCTINVSDFTNAVHAAFDSENKQKLSHFGEVTLALSTGATIVDGEYISSISAVALYRGYSLADIVAINRINGEKAEDDNGNSELAEVLPGATGFTSVDMSTLSDVPATVSEIYSSANGYVFKLTVQGFRPGLVILVGVDNDGKIAGAKHIESNETYGQETELNGAYVGTDADSIEKVIASGATENSKTSNAYFTAMTDALTAYGLLTSDDNAGNE